MRTAAEVLALLEPEEPSSSMLVAALHERGLSRAVKAWTVVEGHRTIGVLVLARICADRWEAYPFVIEAAAAEPLAAVLHRTPAHLVCGPAHHVAPLVAHVQRTRRLVEMPVFGVRAGADVGTPEAQAKLVHDERARRATPEDLEAIVDLFNGYELDNIPTVRRLRGYLRMCFELDRPIIVAEEEGQVVGAIRCDGATRQFYFLGAQTVRPEYRGKGYSHVLMSRAVVVGVQAQMGGFTTRSDRNPVPLAEVQDPERAARIADPSLWEEQYDTFFAIWYELWLHRRVRVRGLGRLRTLIERIEGPVRKRPPPAPYPTERPGSVAAEGDGDPGLAE